MPNVVVVGGTIQCSHGGVVQLASGSGLLGIAGAAALTSGMEAGLSFAPGAPGVRTPCPCTTPPPASKPSPPDLAMIAGKDELAQGIQVLVGTNLGSDIFNLGSASL
jgi:hypothetical protein